MFKGALNTTDSDVKECGDHAGTHRFAVRCLVFELLISEDSNLSYRLTNHSATAEQEAEKFERVPAGRAVIGQSDSSNLNIRRSKTQKLGIAQQNDGYQRDSYIFFTPESVVFSAPLISLYNLF